MSMEGLPVEGFCVVAGIPEKAVEIIEELKHDLCNCKPNLDYLNKSGAIVKMDTVNTVTKSLSRVCSTRLKEAISC